MEALRLTIPEPHRPRLQELLVVPMVLVPIAGAAVALWMTGYAWPILTTAAAVVVRRRPGENDELEVIA